MPPKTKITKSMVLDAAFAIARENGMQGVTVRTIAEKLSCSTQPIMYCYNTIDEIKQEIHSRAEKYHDEFLEQNCKDFSMLGFGVAYVKFGAIEKKLFKVLFQSDYFSKKTLTDIINDDSAKMLIELIMKEENIDYEDAKNGFAARFLMVHGMASLLANNSMIYDEEIVLNILNNSFI